MDSNTSSGLKDLLPITSKSSTSPYDFDLAQKLEELSIESNVSLSPQSSSSSSLLSFSIDMPSKTNISLNLEKRKEESKSSDGNGSCSKRNLEKEMVENEKKQLNGRKCFPPPISCLRKVKVGKPYKYLTYDKESESYIVEEIKILNGSLFHASREDGRLKLYLEDSNEE